MNKTLPTPHTRNSQAGFTLLEMILVLIILGFVITPVFSLLATEHERRTTVEEGNREKTILVSLSLYLKQKGHYPCPANPALTPSMDGFGQEYKTGSNCSSNTASSDGNAYIGMLPTHALNLPNRYAANLDNTKYTYAVTQALTQSSTFNNNSGQIRVVNEESGSFLPDPVHFVLVNHGENMKGAVTLHGSNLAEACIGNTLDIENCDEDSTFIEAPISLVIIMMT